jgi:hypothetical protein
LWANHFGDNKSVREYRIERNAAAVAQDKSLSSDLPYSDLH